MTFSCILFILMISCNQETPNELGKMSDVSSKISDQVVQVSSLVVPTTIPDKIDSLALLHAGKIGCDGIRMLLAESEKGNSSYFISFFTDTDGIKEEALYSLEGEAKILNQGEREHLNGILGADKLAKGATNPCWNLTYLFENTNYDSVYGDYFQFSQQTLSTGYFHKVINRLGSPANCCAGNFSGGLNNLVSSHLWANQTKYGKRMVVDKLKVWDGTYRSGDSYTFTSTSAHHDSDWSNNEKCWYVPWPPYEDCWEIDNDVSSVDMMYYVYNE